MGPVGVGGAELTTEGLLDCMESRETVDRKRAMSKETAKPTSESERLI